MGISARRVCKIRQLLFTTRPINIRMAKSRFLFYKAFAAPAMKKLPEWTAIDAVRSGWMIYRINRDGNTGIVNLQWQSEYTRFVNPVRQGIDL